MAKKTKSTSSAANDEVPSPVPLDDTATMTGAPVAVSGAAGDTSVPAAIDNPESESTSEESGNPAAPAPSDAIEGDTHTPQSASGAAAGEASAEPVKPLTGSDLIDAMVAQTEIPTFVSTSPEVEAAASGTNSESSSQEAAAGDAGANAGVSAAFTAEQVNAIRSQILGITIKERREFIVYSTVRYNNVLFERGGWVIVDQDGHAELAADNLVAKDWLLGRLVEG